MTWNNKRESMSQRSMLNQRKTEMSKTKEKWMVVKQKTLTYMEFPIHSFLWTQWTSETMNLGMGKRKGMVEWWMKGKEKQNKIRPTSQDTDLELDFFFCSFFKIEVEWKHTDHIETFIVHQDLHTNLSSKTKCGKTAPAVKIGVLWAIVHVSGLKMEVLAIVNQENFVPLCWCSSLNLLWIHRYLCSWWMLWIITGWPALLAEWQ